MLEILRKGDDSGVRGTAVTCTHRPGPDAVSGGQIELRTRRRNTHARKPPRRPSSPDADIGVEAASLLFHSSLLLAPNPTRWWVCIFSSCFFSLVAVSLLFISKCSLQTFSFSFYLHLPSLFVFVACRKQCRKQCTSAHARYPSVDY